MRPVRLLILCLSWLALLCFRLVHAGTTPDPSSGYRQLLQRGVDEGLYRQIAIGWIDGKRSQTWFLGKTRRPDVNTQFELGAVTEIFTGLLLADSAFHGKLQLDALLSRFMPQGFAFATREIGTTSLQDLAAHRSGLPVVPANLFPTDIADPYADYDRDDLLQLLANWHGTLDRNAARYSPLDAGLLGYVLARELAEPFPIVLHDKILDPLGLKATGFADTAQLVDGHGADGKVSHWHFQVLLASAGLRSTLGDMLRFLQLNLQPGSSALRPAILLGRQEYAHDGELGYGLGWRIVQSDPDGGNPWPLFWCASRTGGFSVFIGFRSDRQQALALLGNTNTDLSPIGLAWLRHLAPSELPALPLRPSSPASDYTGLYTTGDGSQLIVRANDKALTAQWSGQPPVTLRALAADVFAGGGNTLSFQRQANKVVSVLTAHAGFNQLATRLSQRAPALRRIPISADEEMLDAAVGDYQIDADTLVRLSHDGAGLGLQFTASKRRPLLAFAPDRFVTDDGSIELHLRRGKQHQVSSITLQMAGAQRIAKRIDWRATISRSASTGQDPR